MSRWPDQSRTDRLRGLPLSAVLQLCGAQPDRSDRHKWHTAQGALSITGPKFMNWNQGVGGGGAIDLVIHLQGRGFKEALQWLERHFPGPHQAAELPSAQQPELRLPRPQPQNLERVKRYLSVERALSVDLIQSLISSEILYADGRANAVFLLLGKENRPVGAELRGTGPMAWRGLAPGSRKDLGFFSLPVLSPFSPSAAVPAGIILCESAIDALSCLLLHPNHRCISTAGARPNPRWLPNLLASGSKIYCGFDADPTGDAMAQAMIARHPAIQRLHPPHHDWNDTLRFAR